MTEWCYCTAGFGLSKQILQLGKKSKIQLHLVMKLYDFQKYFITSGLTVSSLCYLWHEGRSVPVAGDEDDEWVVIWVHKYTSCLSAGGVKCCGAAPMGALDTAALHLPLYPLPAVHTFLKQ